MGLADQIILRGTRAAQPAAASLTPGALYCVTDEGRIIERTTGAAWEAFSSAAGSGDVTASGTLTASRLIVGGGTTVVSALASLGTTTTLLHGNAAGAPTFGAVVEADITLADNTTNNAATTKHGLLKKLSNVATEYMDGTGAWSVPAGSGSGTVVQMVNTQTGAVATGTTTIPADDTIPQNTEGTEFLTLAITPTDVANMLKIEVVFICSSSDNASTPIVALFQDTTADALAASWLTLNVALFLGSINFTHTMVAGTTSATTFKVRAGPAAAATITLNGQSGARKLGGVSASSLSITEYVP